MCVRAQVCRGGQPRFLAGTMLDSLSIVRFSCQNDEFCVYRLHRFHCVPKESLTFPRTRVHPSARVRRNDVHDVIEGYESKSHVSSRGNSQVAEETRDTRVARTQ